METLLRIACAVPESKYLRIIIRYCSLRMNDLVGDLSVGEVLLRHSREGGDLGFCVRVSHYTLLLPPHE